MPLDAHICKSGYLACLFYFYLEKLAIQKALLYNGNRYLRYFVYEYHPDAIFQTTRGPSQCVRACVRVCASIFPRLV